MFSSSIAIVIGPTPPGTGVICDARFIASENFSYPRVGNSSEKKQGECLSAKRFVLFIGGMNLRFILIFGIKPLNVGEMEELRCYSRHPNSTSKCKELGTRVRREYHRTGTYKPYDKKK